MIGGVAVGVEGILGASGGGPVVIVVAGIAVVLLVLSGVLGGFCMPN
jgi:hypothetical protein